MKRRSAFILLAAVICFGLHTVTLAQENKIQLGAGLVLSSGALGFEEIDNDIGLRAEGIYPVDEQIRVLADFTFFFPKKEDGVTATVMGLNVNGHYLFFAEDDITAYGLAGINIAIVNVDIPEQDSPFGGFGGNDSDSEFGLNLGGGVEYALEFGKLFGELKFAGLGGDADQLVFGAGARFPI